MVSRVSSLSELSEKALIEIRRRIFCGVLKPNDRIREAEIARELDVSRGPVREALQALERSGLVVKSHNKSYRVIELTDRDIFELHTTRIALESLAARLSFGREGTIAAMTVALEKMRAAVAAGDRDAVVACDRAFHQAMIDNSDHRRLSEMYETLSDQMQFALIGFAGRKSDVSHLVRNHEILIDCAKNGTADEMSDLISQHIQTSSDFMRRVG